jgi:antitoxin component of RelBE/YafQ-DinJ toxin-antitoxin module
MVLDEVCYFRLETKVKEKAEKVAEALGRSFSEYVRDLVISDLDKRGLFATQIKKAKAEA